MVVSDGKRALWFGVVFLWFLLVSSFVSSHLSFKLCVFSLSLPPPLLPPDSWGHHNLLIVGPADNAGHPFVDKTIGPADVCRTVGLNQCPVLRVKKTDIQLKRRVTSVP